MTRAQARAALDEALEDGVKRLFEVMVQNLTAGTPGAADKFRAGLAHHSAAHAAAAAEVEAVFPE